MATMPIQPAQEQQEEPAPHLQPAKQPNVVQQQQQEEQSEQLPKRVPPKDVSDLLCIYF